MCMSKPEVALLISSYQRPNHLARCLLSVAHQECDHHQLEIVVTDDGSRDETSDVVRKFASSADFPVRFTTHRHGQFHLSRCRNEGVRASSAPYLIFLDGDLLIPPDFVQLHLSHRRSHTMQVGDSCWFDRETSERIVPANIRSGAFEDLIPSSEKQRLRGKAFRGLI